MMNEIINLTLAFFIGFTIYSNAAGPNLFTLFGG